MALQNGLGHHPTMSMYVDLAKRLAPEIPELNGGHRCTDPPPARFVFDENSIRTATELTLGRPKVYRQVMANSRVPYPAVWFEWEDAGRAKLREKFKQSDELTAIRPIPERFGFFIESGANYDDSQPRNYRRGKITWAWTQKTDFPTDLPFLNDIPNISGITSHFDLDMDMPIDFIERYPLQLARLWKDNPVQHEEFRSIWRSVRQEVNEPAIAPMVQSHRDPKMREFARALLFADVVGEYIMSWACLMVLSAARNRKPQSGGVEIRSVDMSRLNKNRSRKGNLSLLDHRTVHIVKPQYTPQQMRAPLDYSRKSPHIHLVSCYLSVNGNLVFPYTRGSRPAS